MKREYRGSLLSQEILEKERVKRERVKRVKRVKRLKEDLELTLLAALIFSPLFAHFIELVMKKLQQLNY